MNLIIDQGNTRSKTAVFSDDELLYAQQFEGELQESDIIELQKKFPFQNSILSSVASEGKQIKEILKDCSSTFIELSPETPVPLENLYQTPETLGLDRLALAVAATKLAPKTDALVISAGTCITYDFITAKNEFLGGAISPGLRMRARAMHEFTERLPLVDLPTEIGYCGANSITSLQSGILKGVSDEIDGKITFFKAENPNGKIFLTGGDQKYLINSIKSRTFALPNMVLIGLNEILQHNIKRP